MVLVLNNCCLLRLGVRLVLVEVITEIEVFVHFAFALFWPIKLAIDETGPRKQTAFGRVF